MGDDRSHRAWLTFMGHPGYDEDFAKRVHFRYLASIDDRTLKSVAVCVAEENQGPPFDVTLSRTWTLRSGVELRVTYKDDITTIVVDDNGHIEQAAPLTPEEAKEISEYLLRFT